MNFSTHWVKEENISLTTYSITKKGNMMKREKAWPDVSCKNETKAGLTNSTTQFKLENFVHERTEQFYLGFPIGLYLQISQIRGFAYLNKF